MIRHPFRGFLSKRIMPFSPHFFTSKSNDSTTFARGSGIGKIKKRMVAAQVFPNSADKDRERGDVDEESKRRPSGKRTTETVSPSRGERSG
jgi:hypothetical protein